MPKKDKGLGAKLGDALESVEEKVGLSDDHNKSGHKGGKSTKKRRPRNQKSN